MSHSKDLRSKIQLAMKACEQNSPSPTANMMKFHQGNLVTYGGTLCVQIPCNIDADCVFNPQSLLSFFRKERDKVTYTVKDDRMLVRSGRERVTIRSFPGEGMPILDVHREPVKVTKFLKKRALKSMIEVIDPSDSRIALQGMCLRGGLATGTNGKVILSMPSGLPKDISCTVPAETLKFIASLDEEVEGVAYDNLNIKFFFPSGMTATSRTIMADGFPNVLPLIRDGEKGEKVVLHKDTLDEIRGLKSDHVTISHSGVCYKTDNDNSFGEIELKTEDRFAFSANRKMFELLLSLTFDNTIFISKEPQAIHANGKKYFKMVLAQIRTPSHIAEEKDIPF